MIIDDIVSFVPEEANVTNDQILKFLDSIKMTKGDAEFMAKYNGVVDDIKCFFYDFAMPVEEFGAMGYCEEEDVVYYIGAIPEEFTNQ